ncbi:MAG: polyprenyl synthetase family protein [Alistipes sp.]|nr:polyprenyl synthetase family protein [Alistipes sp.]
MEFKETLSARTAEIEAILDKFLPQGEGFQKIIFEAMEYSVKAGGKRLRPLLMQEAFRIFSGEGALIEPFMAAMEMLHTYSLVHDDLPCMDNDEFRRGRETTWKVYGEGMGVLCGDALLNYAYETAAGAFLLAETAEDYKKISGALRVFMEKAGVHGMIGGQVADVLNEGKEIDRETLDFIFRLKTGALLEASLMIGAILAGADEEQVRTMERVGKNIGTAFQIRDDILDVVGNMEELGKPIHSDEKNKKTTYVTLYGMEKAREDVQSYTQAAMEELGRIKTGGTEFLEKVLWELIYRTK